MPLQPKNSLFSPQSGSGNTTVSPDLRQSSSVFVVPLYPHHIAGPSHLGHSARITDTFPNPKGCWSSGPLLLGLPPALPWGFPHACKAVTWHSQAPDKMTSYVFFLPEFLHLHSHRGPITEGAEFEGFRLIPMSLRWDTQWLGGLTFPLAY